MYIRWDRSRFIFRVLESEPEPLKIDRLENTVFLSFNFSSFGKILLNINYLLRLDFEWFEQADLGVSTPNVNLGVLPPPSENKKQMKILPRVICNH